MRRMSKVGIGLLDAPAAKGVYNLGRRMSASVVAGLNTEEAVERDSVPTLFSPSRNNSISGPSRSNSISGSISGVSGLQGVAARRKSLGPGSG